MIVTLAGHVDHGKTSLVQALTGVNTDRLEEEKRRGLTIDLGFAYLEAGGQTIGFVDVPGHHRFIHNMVAGISSDQFALLVVAADDGPMPQSREHLQILNLLGVSRGVIALTKCDRVADERRLDARAEIASLVRGSCLEGVEIVETSVESGEGVEALQGLLTDVADRDSGAGSNTTTAFRLPIDRAFTIAGAGVVVTGTIHNGQVNPDQPLRLFPSDQPVRVKTVRAQNQAVQLAGPGDRCALNLSGVEIGDVARGDWLTDDSASKSDEFSLQLTVLDDFPRAIRHWLPVHVYHATTHTTGRIALLTDQRIAPGGEGLVELVTDDELLVQRGDRLVIRDQGLDRTLGGGSVVSVQPPSGRRRADLRLRALAADTLTDPRQALAAHLDLGAVRIEEFRQNLSLPDTVLRDLLSAEACLVIEDHAVRSETWQQWQDALLAEIEQRHAADSAMQGLKQSELTSAAGVEFIAHLLNALTADGKLIARAGRYLPAEHKISLSDAEQALFDRVEPLLNQPQPPSLGDMAKQFRLGVGDLAKRLHPLVAKKYLVRISDSRYYLPGHLKNLAGLAIDLHASGPFTVRQYRDAAEIGRNVAIEVLEHFDRVGFTRRNADTRQIIGQPPDWP